MEDIVVSTNTDSVIAVSTTTNTISVVEIEPVLISTDNGSIVTVGTESTVVVESKKDSLVVTGLIGPPGISEEDVVYSKRVDFISDLELYKGEAAVGSLETAAVWRIRQIVLGNDGDVSEKWASGTANFDKVWADRATLTYI